MVRAALRVIILPHHRGSCGSAQKVYTVPIPEAETAALATARDLSLIKVLCLLGGKSCMPARRIGGVRGLAQSDDRGKSCMPARRIEGVRGLARRDSAVPARRLGGEEGLGLARRDSIVPARRIGGVRGLARCDSAVPARRIGGEGGLAQKFTGRA